MTSAAETTTTTKRTRFDPSASAGKVEATSPKALAANQVKAYIVSLQQDIGSILEKLGLNRISLQAKALNKSFHITTMEDDEDFIPRSDRIEFSYKMSKKAEEKPEFIALQEETIPLIIQIRKQLKTKVLAATKIELQVLQAEVLTDLAKAIRITTQAFLLQDGIDKQQVDRTVSTLLSRDHVKMLKQIPVTHEEFLSAYKAAAGINAMPVPIQTAPVTSQSENSPGTSRHFGRRSGTSVSADMTVDLSTEDQKIIEIISKIQRALELTMIIPWTVYMDTRARLEISSSLKKLNTEYFAIEATEGATMDVDDEDAADRQQLQELVRKQSEANTKSLQQDLKKLQQQVKGLQSSTAKNGQRVPPSASKQKQKGGKGHAKAKSDRSKSPRTRTNGNQQDREAGDAASDSGKNNSNNRSRQPSKKKSHNKRSNGQQVSSNNNTRSTARS
jgi:hypothetical protein